MKHVITNAAEITVLEPIDNTYKTGGGPVSVGGTVVVASKGPVGKIVQVLDQNREALFGKPLPKKAYGMEGLRHLADATKKCNYVNVVRVVAQDAKFPTLAFKLFAEKGAWVTATAYNVNDVVTVTGGKIICKTAHTSSATAPTYATPGVEWEKFTSPVTASAVTYGTAVSVSDGFWLAFWPIDGDPSGNRVVRVLDVKETTLEDGSVNGRFTLGVYDKNDMGGEYLIESLEVGISPDDVDDMGLPAFIETVFEQQSDYFRCDFNDSITWAQLKPVLESLKTTTAAPQSFAFSGGTNGGEPTVEDWKAAWELLRDERIPVNLLFAGGCYEEEVISIIAEIADDRHVSAFADVPPGLKSAAAIAWQKAIGIKSRHLRWYYSPYSATDEWRGGKTVWGVSGAAAAAKANGNSIFTGNVPGIHYAPAGAKRGVLTRTGIVMLFPDDRINRDDMYDARINPIVPLTEGGAMIDDDVTAHYQQNYTRFGWVNDILDYIDHRFLEAAGYAKFEPDGLTYSILYDLTKEILDQLVTSGALVKPRNPQQDGTNPYVITIKQLEIDLWHVQWDICPTGAARRIAGQPRLIK